MKGTPLEGFQTQRSRRLAVLLLAVTLLNLLPSAVHASGQATAGGQSFDPIKGIQSLWAWFAALFHALLDGRGGTAGQTKPTDGMVQPPVKPPEPLPDPRAMEREIFALINKERAGIKPVPYTALVWDEKLAAVARARAEEALATGEYGHDLPSGSLDAALTKIGYLSPARENATLRQSAVEAFKSWMDSPGHRASILWPEARSVGVGVAVSKTPVKMRDLERAGAVYEGIHVAVYAIFYDGK